MHTAGSALTPKRRCTGPRAAMTSRCSMRCSMREPTSRRLELSSVAGARSPTRADSATGQRPGDSSSEVRVPAERCCCPRAAGPSRGLLCRRIWTRSSGDHRSVLECLPRWPAGTAEYLLERGAEINWIGWDEKTPLDVVDENAAPDLAAWLRARGAKHANELQPAKPDARLSQSPRHAVRAATGVRKCGKISATYPTP